MNRHEEMEWGDRLHFEAIARCVRRRRAAAGWTQAQLAARACLSRSEIQHLEHGRRDLRLGTLRRVCAAFGITTVELMAEVDRVEHELARRAR